MIDQQNTETTIKANEWKDMTVDQLLSQKSLMFSRYEFMLTKGAVAAQPFAEGIAKLDALLSHHLLGSPL